MEIKVNDEFRTISRRILDENKDEAQWAEIESDDMFQTESFVGGYDADEEAFCFSYYDETGKELWFQLTLDEIREVANGVKQSFEARPAET
jgi:hypothetical protein